MHKLTFTEYLNSKDRLRELIKENTSARIAYNIKKYCKLRVGESKKLREEIALKPNQVIIVEWHYITEAIQVPLNIDDGVTTYSIYWSQDKLQNWLSKNSFETLL